MPPPIVIRACKGESEYLELVAIWRSSVTATHEFLAPEHQAAIEKKLAADYFPQVKLTVAELAGEPVGFAGVVADRLEMLFIAAPARGQGVGGALLARTGPQLD